MLWDKGSDGKGRCSFLLDLIILKTRVQLQPQSSGQLGGGAKQERRGDGVLVYIMQRLETFFGWPANSCNQ